jgi:ribosomal protein L37AE/L43A
MWLDNLKRCIKCKQTRLLSFVRLANGIWFVQCNECQHTGPPRVTRESCAHAWNELEEANNHG